MEHRVKVNLNSVKLNQKDRQIKAYKRRWVILTIFIFYSAMNAFQWIEYAIITNIVMKYYNVSSVAVDWTSIIYMALYSPLVIPASYIIDKRGLRAAALLGGLGTALGTTIKVFSIGRDLFYVVLLGQGILAASQLLILCLPPKIASVWFKPNEVSTVCSLGVFGTQLGCAVGFVIPPMIVKNHLEPDNIGQDLRILSWGLTALMIPGALAVIFYFPLQPPKPPSVTQAEERTNRKKFTMSEFFDSIKTLLTNRAFMIHAMAYGINIAVFCAASTLLNQFVLQYFPNAEEDAGRMGLVMITVGMVGSILFGIFLDKTHKYKETTFFIYIMSAVSVAGFMCALERRSKLLVYISMGVVGLFTNAYMPVSFELAMELTFPSPETTTTGLLLALSQILGVIFTLVTGKLNILLGPFWALSSLVIMLSVGTVITGFIPNELKRQEAFQNQKSNTIIEFDPLPIVDK